MSAPILTGIAGWSYEDWKGIVYPKDCKDTLRYCARFVDCIEINSTFYHPPSARAAASWVERTADLERFFFTAKLPRTFTHDLVLDPEVAGRTREGFEPLREAGKLRVLLAQFSYRFEASEEALEHLRGLIELFDDLAPIVVEVRHRSWADRAMLERMSQLGVSVAALDYPGYRSGFGLWRTGVYGRAGIAYFRLHGRNRAAWFSREAGRDETYDYDYKQPELCRIAERAREIAAEARAEIVIANNHYRGQELKTALQLRALLEGHRVAVPELLLAAYPELVSVAASSAGAGDTNASVPPA